MSARGKQRGGKQVMTSMAFSLRGRLLFLICLATLPAILFTFFVADNERAAALARTERDALHLAGLASREHAHQIRGARELLAWLGTKLRRHGTASPVLADEALLKALLAGHPQLANIGVLSADGRVLRSAYPLDRYRSWKDNPAYLAALRSKGVVAGRYLVSPIFERPTLNHAYAVRDKRGQVVAVLFNGLDLGWLSKLTHVSVLPDGFSLLIADRRGRVLARGRSSSTPRASGGDARIAGIARLAASQRGRMVQMRGSGARRYFVATALQQAPGLFVAVGLPYARVLGRANSVFYRTLAGLSVLTLFTIGAVFVAAELGLLRGLRSLAGAARRLGAGDLSVRVKAPRGHHELASLADAFNAMADSLALRHGEALDAQARLRALANRAQMAREIEAGRISRELHDEIGQLLTSLKIDLSRLQSSCAPGQRQQDCATALAARTTAMASQIDAAMDFVRRISAELRPGVLDKLGLAAAIEWQAREIERRTDLAIQVDIDDVEARFEDLVAVTLFRIVQEALTNVVRHARAHTVQIQFATKGEQLWLTVHDDGDGIAEGAVDSDESLGIVGMRERALLIGGRVTIAGEPGVGTTVAVTVPRQPPREVSDAHPSG